MGILKLTDLPVEVLSVVVGHIKYKPNLIALCLTCKVLRDEAVKVLYNTVHLEVGTANDHRTTQLLTARNVGLKYVRELQFESSAVRASTANFALGILLDLLPVNRLRKVHWRAWQPMSPHNLQLLSKCQTELDRIETIPGKEIWDESMIPSRVLTSLVSKAQSLAIYVMPSTSLAQAQEMLKLMQHSITRLDIQVIFGAPEKLTFSDDSGSAEDKSAARASTLCRLLNHFIDSATKVSLRQIVWHGLSLTQPGLWVGALDESALTWLHLVQCNGAPEALLELANTGTLSSLVELQIDHCASNNTGDTIKAALEALLPLLSGLTYLQVDICCQTESLDFDLFLKDGYRLWRFAYQIVADHTAASVILPLPVADWTRAAQTYKWIRQLALPFPDHNILSRFSCGDLRELIEGMTNSESQLKYPRTLQFLSWPIYDNQGNDQMPLTRCHYDQMLRTIATWLFDARNGTELALPSLGIIAFGCRKRGPKWKENDFTIFVRGKETVPWGPSRYTAVQVTRKWLTYEHDGCVWGLDHEHAVSRLPKNVKARDPEVDEMPLDVAKPDLSPTPSSSVTDALTSGTPGQ